MAITHQRRARLSIDVPREARRRIHIAAAKRDKSIRQYVWEAVEARLKHDLADELSAADLVALNERADPVLPALWDNPKDAAAPFNRHRHRPNNHTRHDRRHNGRASHLGTARGRGHTSRDLGALTFGTAIESA